MKPAAAICLAVHLAVLTPSGSADANGSARQAYVARAEPICRAGDEATQPLLHGTHHMATHGEPVAAGRRFIRASSIFGATAQKVSRLKPPPGDTRQITDWIDRLAHVKEALRHLGLALKHRNRLKALNRVGQLREAGTSANKAVRGFHFHYCHIYESRFS